MWNYDIISILFSTYKLQPKYQLAPDEFCHRRQGLRVLIGLFISSSSIGTKLKVVD